MRRAAALAALAIVTAAPAPWLATVLAAPAVALADGDPASDVLVGQDVFLPYGPISPVVQRQLYSVTAAARRAGYPLKVALIASRSDLGVVPALFGRPEQYARFLSAELIGLVDRPVLVVMPAGFGLAYRGSEQSLASLTGIRIGAGGNGLGTAAVIAGERLAAAAGHPLPAGAAAGQAASAGAGASTVRDSLIAIAVLCVVAAVAVGAAVVIRARRAPAV